MKVYTKEQVIKAYKIGHNDGHTGVFDCSIEELSLTPIELPSDDKIKEAAFKLYPKFLTDPHNPDEDGNAEERKIWIKGIKWMKKQILNQK